MTGRYAINAPHASTSTGMLFPSAWTMNPADPPEHDVCPTCRWDAVEDGHAPGCPADLMASVRVGQLQPPAVA